MNVSFDGKSHAFYLQDMAMNNTLPHVNIAGIDKLIYLIGHNAPETGNVLERPVSSYYIR